MTKRRLHFTYREQQILSVAAVLFADKGYSRTSLQDIGDKIKIRKQSLYHFFASKEDIYFTILRKTVLDIVTNVKKISEMKGQPSKILRNIIGYHALQFKQNEFPTKVYMRGTKKFLKRTRQNELRNFEREYNEIIQKVIQDGINVGEFRNDFDNKVIVFAISIILSQIGSWYSVKGRLSINKIANDYATFILRGLISDINGQSSELNNLINEPNWLGKLDAKLKVR